jgi:protein O-mannosyl-transferase
MSRAQTLPKIRAQGRKRANPGVSGTGQFLNGKMAALCVLLAGATMALYSPVFGYSFLAYDDSDYVVQNPHVRQGLAWSTFKWAFTTFTASNWHPLTWLSHALDYQLFALNPAGHHIDSVLIHALNAVLLFLLLSWFTGRVGPSLFVASLFAVHPLNVESVAWVAERKNVLSTFFFLLAIGAYGWYARKPDWRRYLLLAALFAAGLMAKPMVITLPFVLLLLDYWPLARIQTGHSGPDGAPRVRFTALLLEKVPLLLLSAASAATTLLAQRRALSSLQRFPLSLRLENAVVSYGSYLWKMVWPVHLAVLYPFPALALPVWQWLLSAIFLIAVTVLAVVFRSRRYLPMGWFWFLGTLVPVIGLVQVGNAAMSDRYAYVPLIGIFVMIAWSLDDWAKAKKVRAVWEAIPAVCIVLALGALSVLQMGYWDSNYHLWSHALAVTEENPVAHGAVAGALIHPEQGMTQQEREAPDTDTDEKRMEEAQRHHEQALQIYRQLAEKNPDVYQDYVALLLKDLGNLNRDQNRLDEARQNYAEALAIYRHLPQQTPDARFGLALLLDEYATLDGMQNLWDGERLHNTEALQLYRKLAEQRPDTYLPGLARTLNSVGTLDLRQNRMDEARQHYDEALQDYRQLAQQDDKYTRDVAGTLTYLGFLNRNQKRIAESRADYQEALTILQKLLQSDANYANQVAGVEAILRALDQPQAGAAK